MKLKEYLKLWLFFILPTLTTCVAVALFLTFVIAPISSGAVLFVLGIIFAFVFTLIVNKWLDFLIDKGVFK